MGPQDLHVVTVINNPVRFQSRWLLWENFQARMRAAGVKLLTVELTYGEHAPVCGHGYGDHLHVALPTADQFWHKENLVNIGLANLPRDWRYAAWVDADVDFVNPRWVEQTLDRLQLSPVVQMFAHVVDLSPDHDAVMTGRPVKAGFAYSYRNRLPVDTRYDGGWHSGFAWAIRRDALDAIGGLMDFCVLGSADWHMAMAFVGDADKSWRMPVTEPYRKAVLAWSERADHAVLRDIDYVPGLVHHWWHGKKKDRRYHERWQILTRWHFDPTTDVFRDQGNRGVLRWSHHRTPRLRHLRDDIRRYLRSRREDSVDLV